MDDNGIVINVGSDTNSYAAKNLNIKFDTKVANLQYEQATINAQKAANTAITAADTATTATDAANSAVHDAETAITNAKNATQNATTAADTATTAANNAITATNAATAATTDATTATTNANTATTAANDAALSANNAATTAINSIMMYDCSAKGTVTFATLDLAIASVPLVYQKGGLHIKFVDTASNKYNTYFLTTPTWSISTSDWQYSNENIKYAKNGTGYTVAKGKVVYINSSTGGNPIFQIATNADYAIASRAWGITMDSINNNAVGRVIHFGMLENLDTSAYAAGTELWLGVNGAFTNVRPTSPAFQTSIGMVIRQHATVGSIFVNMRYVNIEGVRSQNPNTVPSSKLLDDELVQVRSDLNILNISTKYPLMAGNYYTLTTARAAVTTSERQLGKRITYLTASKEIYVLTISGTTTSDGNIYITLNDTKFSVPVLIGDTAADISDKIKTAEFTGWLQSGLLGTAITTFTKSSIGPCSAPIFSGVPGVTATFLINQVGEFENWVEYQFIGKTTNDIDWNNNFNWVSKNYIDISVGKNLINPNNIIKGNYWTENGLLPNALFNDVSINDIAGRTITINDAARSNKLRVIGYERENGTKVSIFNAYTQMPYTYNVPSDAKTLHVSYHVDTQKLQVEIGNKASVYEEYKIIKTLKEEILISENKFDDSLKNKMYAKYNTINSRNLANQTNSTSAIFTTTGIATSNVYTNYSIDISSYIEKKVTINVRNASDTSYTGIYAIGYRTTAGKLVLVGNNIPTPYTYNVPSDASILYITIATAGAQKLQVELGERVSAYEECKIIKTLDQEIKIPSLNYLFGKKIAVLGDSMVAGHTLNFSQTWGYKLAARNNMYIYNYGYNGSYLTNKDITSGSVTTHGAVVRYADMINDADYIVVWCGTNDARQVYASTDEILLGDINNSDINTVYGALNHLLPALQNKYPISKILILTPFNRDPFVQQGSRKPYANTIIAIKTVCEKYSIAYYEVGRESGISWNNVGNRLSSLALNYPSDSYHLSEAGHEYISYSIEQRLRML